MECNIENPEGKSQGMIISIPEFHLGFLSRGANATIAKLSGGGGTIVIFLFSSVRNIMVLIDHDCLKMGVSGGMLPQEVFLISETVSSSF